MNSVISAFKTKKNSSSNAGSVQTMANNDKQHNSLGLISSSLSTTSSKKKAINAQDNSYQYLRHIREIDTATKLLSPVVMADDLLETEMLNFRPATVTPMTSVDVVDHVPIVQTVRITSGLDRASSTDCNMNGSKQITCEQPAPSAVLENGNCNEVVVDSMTALNGQLTTANSSSPTQHLVDIADDDESEHSITACTSTTSSSSSSEHSNSTVVHSPIATQLPLQQQQQQQTLPVSPAKSLNLSLNSSSSSSSTLSSTSSSSSASSSSSSASASASASTSASASASTSSLLSSTASPFTTASTSSSACVALCNSGPSSCSSITSCDVSSTCSSLYANETSAPSSPTLVTRSSHMNTDYMPAFLKSSHVTLPIIMPNSNSSLATLPTSNQCINSAATTPKHSRYSKPRLSLSRFINHSMPSVHGRSNMSIPGAATSGAVVGTGSPTQTNGTTNPPKRASTHQRNLSLDFRVPPNRESKRVKMFNNELGNS
uniref:Uncharacterized protein n=1 Tax=Glossina morsitans morsitans TaxID=37546 RepID=A0A1B0FAZ1_GLOMM